MVIDIMIAFMLSLCQIQKEKGKVCEGMYVVEFYEKANGESEIWDYFYQDNTFVLLHYYSKKTQKTPRREIEKAKKERNDYLMQKEAEKYENME